MNSQSAHEFRPQSARPSRETGECASTDHSVAVIGFVGGVGSGKSFLSTAAAEELRARQHNVVILDGDRVGHETLTKPQIIQGIADAFGSDVVVDKQVDRRRLAALIFGPDAAPSARVTLNEIMHPLMRVVFEDAIEHAVANEALVLFDAAILFEAGWDDLCTACVFADVPGETRLDRVLSRGWTEERWRSTEANQWPLERKRDAVLQFGDRGLIVENASTTPAELGGKIADWVERAVLTTRLDQDADLAHSAVPGQTPDSCSAHPR